MECQNNFVLTMSFENDIYDLEQLLLANDFQLQAHMQNFARYSRDNVVFTISRVPSESQFYFSLGLVDSELNELTPKIVCDFFNDCRFKNQTTLTINNLVSFLSERGENIINANEEVIKNFKAYSLQLHQMLSAELMKNLRLEIAERAWKEKDYDRYIESIDEIDKEYLTEMHLKKYRIAIDKVQRRNQNH